ncbi:amino acid adenylation domain-containing protein [Nonomuraea sp. NPDC050643]|uniref:non-ribosomal peptide synthetase n=1 Tax=Nonomuraea sp. NPDC050643 TaxID=3155660 RepID=UPI0033E7ADCF
MRLSESTAGGTARAVPGPVPAARKEEALWLLEKMVPGSAVNNLSFGFATSGRLDTATLRAALAAVTRRHEILRTVFYAGAAALAKQVLPQVDIEIETMDLDGGDPVEVLSAFVARPFALDGSPLLRAAHVRGGDSKGDFFCLVIHHVIFDTLSTTILRDEFVAAYDTVASGGRAPEAEPVRPLAERAPSESSLAYWRETLRGLDPDSLELWIGSPGVADPTLRGDQVMYELSDEARAAVRAMQRELSAPEAVVLLAAYYVLLAKHGAGPDMTVGFPVNTRGHDGTKAIGFHVNVVPLRVEVPERQSFRDFTRTVRTVFFNGLTHADVPVEHLTNLIPRKGSSWRDALFRHVMNYVPASELTPFEIGGDHAEQLLLENGSSRFDLEFFVLSAAESLRVRAAYCVEVFDRADVESLVRRFDELLVRLASDVDRLVGGLEVWCALDRVVIDTANDTARPVELATVLEGVQRQVRARPDEIAVEHGDDQVTYRRLWDTACATDDLLRAAGIGSGDVVAVAAPRGPELVAAVLGIWLTGAAYLPVDPDHPAERIAYLLSDSAARAVLTTDPGRLPPGGTIPVLMMETVAELKPRRDEPGLPGISGSPAFLIYTSGSTGLPKGTWVTHSNLANLMSHFREALRMTPDEGFLWMTTFSFDISSLELFLPLLCGGRVVVASDEVRTDGKALLGALERHRVNLVQATPTTWRLVLHEAGPALASCRLISGGEPLTEDLSRRMTAVSGEVWNAYAPTETTVYSTMGLMDGGPVDIGRPIGNTQVFIATPEGVALPVGVRGELCVAGAGVTLGYHDRPDLTAQRFLRHPWYGRYYRTGDVARWQPDGTIELFGRNDRQVKLRGNRIELPEVESVLREHPQVRAVAAVVVPDAAAGGVLVACLEGEALPDLPDRLWEHASGRLPAAAVPSDFVFVASFPKTGSNKVDHPALARLAAEHRRRAASATGAAGPRDGLAGALVTLWRELLDRHDLDADANFFSHGGHSVLAAQLVQRIERMTGVRIKLSGVFEHPTPRLLAQHLVAAGVEPGSSSPSPEE